MFRNDVCLEEKKQIPMSLLFDLTGARIHDIWHSNRAYQLLHHRCDIIKNDVGDILTLEVHDRCYILSSRSNLALSEILIKKMYFVEIRNRSRLCSMLLFSLLFSLYQAYKTSLPLPLFSVGFWNWWYFCFPRFWNCSDSVIFLFF